MKVNVVNYYEIKDPKEIKVNNPIEATDENLAKYVKDKFPNADLKSNYQAIHGTYSSRGKVRWHK